MPKRPFAFGVGKLGFDILSLRQTKIAVAGASSVLVLGCAAQPAQTLVGVLQSAEWTCEQPSTEASGEMRLIWQPDGEWFQHTTARFSDNGDAIILKATMGGRYRVEGSTLFMSAERADIYSVTRNGVVQALSPLEKSRMEQQAMAESNGDGVKVTDWNANEIILAQESGEMTCKR